MAKSIYGPPMAKTNYDPQIAKTIPGPQMVKNTFALQPKIFIIQSFQDLACSDPLIIIKQNCKIFTEQRS